MSALRVLSPSLLTTSYSSELIERIYSRGSKPILLMYISFASAPDTVWGGTGIENWTFCVLLSPAFLTPSRAYLFDRKFVNIASSAALRDPTLL